tara:strand:+ start:3811 stop:4614 length:804 start_codon:yes stop_codon:yes gene_type:complete
MSNSINDDLTTMKDFQDKSLVQLDNYKQEYENLKKKYNETSQTNVATRKMLRNKMKSIASNINNLQQTQIAAYDVAVHNQQIARNTMNQQVGTLGVLKNTIGDANYNISILREDDINKARMADININESKEYDDQLELFKMISFYLVFILFFAVLGKYVPVIANITKIACLIITIILIYRVYNMLKDMYSRSSLNYDEYDFDKPRHTNSDVDTDDDTDDDDDDSDSDSDDDCTTTDDIVNHSTSNEDFSNIKAYNSNNKSLLSKSKF